MKHNHSQNTAIRPEFDKYHQTLSAITAIDIETFGDDFKFDMNTDAMVPGSNGIADAIDSFACLFRKEVKSNPSKYGSNPGYVDVLNFGPYVAQGYYLQENSPNVQILNNVVLGTHGMATITLPPFWRRDKARKYPISLHGSGFGGLNTNIHYDPADKYFGGYDPAFAAMAFHLLPDSGVICIYVNNGGRESAGINQGLLDNLQLKFQNTFGLFGGDVNRIVTAGGSRGGNEAGVWGTLTNGMNTRAILAGVPPIKIGTMGRYSLSTSPALAAVNVVLGSTEAWRHDYDGLSQYDKAKTVSRIWLGTGNLDSADTVHSMYGHFLRADTANLNKKLIHFTYGSHDAFFPLSGFLQFDSMLTRRGIKHSSHIGYAIGHGIEVNTEMDQAAWRAIGDTVGHPYTGVTRKFMLPLQGNSDISSATKLRWMNDANIDTILMYRPHYFPDSSDHNPDSLSFSALIPWQIVKNRPFEIVVSGQTGKPWRIWARDENGYEERFRASGTFGTRSTVTSPISLADSNRVDGGEYAIMRELAFPDTGTLEWFFEYDGKEVPNRFTPHISAQTQYLRAMSKIVAAQSGEIDGYKYYFRDRTRNGLGNGVDQIHPLLFSENKAATFDFIPTQTIDVDYNGTVAFSCSTYVNRGTGANRENDSLRYDLRGIDANGQPTYITTGQMDRKTGIFSINPSTIYAGTHTVTVSVTDGKGGNASRAFSVIAN